MRRRRALIVLILLAVIVSWEVWFFAPCSNTGTEHCGEEWVVLAGLRWSMHLFNEVGQWLQSLHGGAPPFLGALTGSLLGLLGILVGALFNANLNRKRDDRLRQQEALLVIVALRVELVGLRDSLINNAERL